MRSHDEDAHALLAPQNLNRHLSEDHDVDPVRALSESPIGDVRVWEAQDGVDPMDMTQEERRLNYFHNVKAPHKW